MTKYLVYMHINRINQKKYVGITHYENPEKRWLGGRGYMNNPYFSKAILKNGWDNFDHIIIARGLSKEDACQFERMMIQANQTQNRKYGYNITDGGEYFHHTEESKRLMSQNRKGKGLHHFSDEHIQRMKKNHKGGSDKKKVLCIETGVIYESINDAARAVNKNKKMISNCCRNVEHYNTAAGYHWEFVSNQ